jgi:diaminohydroxyphosphoribosylaminopyrimidine deaminase/5-amino-6-(5-phosphoribosylamino)uracil reductase
MVEGGPTLAAALARKNLIDAAVLFCSSNEIGPDGIDALEGLPLTALTHSPNLQRVGTDEAGADRIEMFERS